MMKGYEGTFTKTNGDERAMTFVRVQDLPSDFLATKVKNTGQQRTLKEGTELVWDITAQGFRTFNWKTVVGEVQEINLEENSLFPLTTD